MKNGKYLTYYSDSSSFDYIVKHADADMIVAHLKGMREQRKAVSYLSAWNVTELLITFEKKPDLARRLITAARDICGYRIIRDTPGLLTAEMRHLENAAIDADPLICATEPETFGVKEDLEQAIQDPGTLTAVIGNASADALGRKRADEVRTEEFVKALNEMDGREELKFKDIHEFFDWAFNRSTYAKTVAEACAPPSGYVTSTPAAFAARIQETVSFRALVYFELSMIYYKNFTTMKRYQKHWGDAIDTHHVVYGAHFDIFVSDDANCRTYAAKGAEGKQQIMSMAEFLEMTATL